MCSSCFKGIWEQLCSFLICSALTIPCFHNISLGAGHDKLCYPEALKLNCDQSGAPLVFLKMWEKQLCGFEVMLHWNNQRGKCQLKVIISLKMYKLWAIFMLIIILFKNGISQKWFSYATWWKYSQWTGWNCLDGCAGMEKHKGVTQCACLNHSIFALQGACG